MSEDMERWSKDAYRELEACETRAGEIDAITAPGIDACCAYIKTLRAAGITHIHVFFNTARSVAIEIKHCPLCGRRLTP